MKFLKIMLVCCLSTANLNANTTTAPKSSEAVGCDQVLNACDAALEGSLKENAILRDLNAIKQDEINRLRIKDDSALQTKIIWGVVGALIGVAGGVYLTTK